MSSDSIDGGTRLRVRGSVLFEELDGEAVLLDLDAGIYYGLDAVGTRAWGLIAEHGRLDEVTRTMLREYDVDERRLHDDLGHLVADLLDKGLLEKTAPR